MMETDVQLFLKYWSRNSGDTRRPSGDSAKQVDCTVMSGLCHWSKFAEVISGNGISSVLTTGFSPFSIRVATSNPVQTAAAPPCDVE